MKTFQFILLLLLLVLALASEARAEPPPDFKNQNQTQTGDTTAARVINNADYVARLKDRILYGVDPTKDDPRKDEIAFDPDSGIVELRRTLDNNELGYRQRMPVRAYTRYLTHKNLEEQLERRSYLALGAVAEATGAFVPGRFRIEVPFALPGIAQSIFGKQRPNLSLSGSETLTLGGTSSFNNQPTVSGRQSKFPQLEMKQDLQVRVAGNIGEKVKVDVDQTSNAAATPLSNRIHIGYTGDEDEVVRSLELGNTNLSLPGTQFVSYSGQHQGLFGLKTITKLGPTDLTVIASKEEGQSKRDTFRRSSQARVDRLEDYQFVQRTFFYLTLDPNEDIDYSTVHVYFAHLTSLSGTDRALARSGKAYLDPTKVHAPEEPILRDSRFIDEPEVSFYKKTLNNRGDGRLYIELTSPMDESSVLGVSYKRKDGTQVGTNQGDTLIMKLLRPNKDQLTTDSSGVYLPAAAPGGYWNATLPYELRNIYRLSGTNIDPEKFKLHIYTTKSNPPQDYVLQDKLIEMTGLDNEVISGSNYSFGQSGKGDDRIDSDDGNRRVFMDPVRGLIFFPDARPFAAQPDTGLGYTSQDLDRRPSLLTPDLADSNIYVLRTYNPNDASRPPSKYYLEATYRESQGEDIIRLGQTDILAGSEVVTINGRRLIRDTDYRITPEIGEIQILNRDFLLGNPDIQIDYAYASLFSTSSKALVGFSAAYGAGSDHSAATTWLFENTSAQDLRPRLGDEPSRTIVGDMNAQGRWSPAFLTHLVDKIPLVHTTAESNVSAQAEVALSLPNPNTKGNVWVDDFEGVKDLNSVDLGFRSWKWSSVPDSTFADPQFSMPFGLSNARAHWFNTISRVREGDLKPALTGTEASATRRTLELRLERDPLDNTDRPLWAGIQQGLFRETQDLSTVTDVEMWVNEHPENQVIGSIEPRLWPDGARLHVDFGLVSEDAMWQPNVAPNGIMDSENQQGAASFSAVLDDRGLDTLSDANEPGDYASKFPDRFPNDPAGDNFHDVTTLANDEYKDATYYQKYDGVNGTQGNRIFDTEDLDGNTSLETQTQYFEYSVPLNGLTDSPFKVESGAQGLGWKFLRIPVAAFTSSSKFTLGGGPASWRNIKHVRIWVSGGQDGDRVSFAEMSLVGNRWQNGTIVTTDTVAARPRLRVSTVNNKDNLEYTTPPGVDPGTSQSGTGAVTNREQSLTLETGNLTPQSSVSAFRLFQRQSADYTLYRSLNFFLKGKEVEGDGLRFFMRLGDLDTTNYYEYSTPVPRGDWRSIHLDFAALTNLKTREIGLKDTTIAVALPGDSTAGLDSVKVRKRPSFNNLQRITMGLYNATTGLSVDSAVVWVDELTLGDVRRDVGTAQRASLDMALADFGQVGFQFQRSGADFLNIGRTVGSGATTTSLGLNMSFKLNKFAEATGVSFPLSIALSHTSSIPKFLTGSDLQLLPEDVTKQTTKGDNLNISSTLSRSSLDSPLLLRYLVDPFVLTGSWVRTISSGPTAKDANKDKNYQLQYNLQPRGERPHFLIPVVGNFYPIPTGLTLTQNRVESEANHSDISLVDSTQNITRPTSTRLTSAMVVSSGYKPFNNLSYTISKTHDLTLLDPDNPTEHKKLFGFFNVGREVLRAHAFTYSQDIKIAGLGPRLDWSGTSGDQKPQDLSSDLSVHNYNNSGTLTMSMELPISRLKPVARAQGDSSGADPLRLVRSVVGTLGNISGNFTLNNTNSTARAFPTSTSFLGDMPLGYILGFSSDTSFGSLGKGGSKTFTRSRHGSAQNSTHLGQVTVDVRWDLTRSKTLGTLGSNGQQSLTWPDLTVRWGALEKFLPLGALATGLNAQTKYSRVERLTFSSSEIPDQSTVTRSWAPLLTFSGELRNHDRFTFSTDKSNTLSDNRLGNGTTESSSKTYKLNIRHVIHGPPIPANAGPADLGFRLRGDVEVNLDGSYQVQGTSTHVLTGTNQAPEDTKRLDISASAGYALANNVRGSVISGYTRTENTRTQLISQNIRLQATASLTF